MSDIAIRVNNVSKLYKIGKRERYSTLRDQIANTFTAPIIWLKSINKDRAGIEKSKSIHDSIWALKDISFEVKQGEAIGIIGRNGAGKSTLLKIVSRITSPTEGAADIYGRVGTLLEVGTGFHPELTGRENIYLNGAILGMKRREIIRKFDEIVAFSEIDEFLDTPVKRYSSGMYVRLAFAVAANLETNILLVDEILSVGDLEFQKKCLGKMSSVLGEGRTILFVSHNMATVENFCGRTILLERGKIIKEGPTKQVIHEYITKSMSNEAAIDCENIDNRTGTGEVRIRKIEFLNANEELCSTVRMGDSLIIRMHLSSNSGQKRISLGTHILTDDGILISDLRTKFMGFDPGLVGKEVNVYDLVIDKVLLLPGTYMISPGVGSMYQRYDYDWIQNIAQFTVEESDFYGTGVSQSAKYAGIVHLPSHWELVKIEKKSK
jgi:lipopolysaccharide transport system ATP-binding protein